ncbi:MAG: FecR domain-containing protein [Planctomycetota bacterium]|jgi:hypothetical protein
MTERLILSIAVVLLITSVALPTEPEGKEASQAVVATAESGAAVKATVVSVTGKAQKLLAGQDAKWVELKAGDQLDELTVIRTGLRTRVVLRFADRCEVEIARATKVGIAQARKQGELVKTHIGLKYGTMRARIDSSKGPNDAKVTTPVATLSVRGSGANIGFTGDRGLGLLAYSGTWRVGAGQRTRNVTAGQATNGQLIPPIDLKKQQQGSVMGDFFGGLTGSEWNHGNNNNNTPGSLPGIGPTPSSGMLTNKTIGKIDPHHIVLMD